MKQKLQDRIPLMQQQKKEQNEKEQKELEDLAKTVVCHWYSWNPLQWKALKPLCLQYRYGEASPPLPVFIHTDLATEHSRMIFL